MGFGRWLKKAYKTVDKGAGGFLPGGMDPKDVTWRDSVGTIGAGLKRAAPLAAAIPGVGPLAAAGLGAAGGMMDEVDSKDGFNFGSALGDALKGGAWGGVGGMAVSGLAGQGTGQLGKFAASLPGRLGGALKGAGGAAKGVMDYMTDGEDGMNRTALMTAGLGTAANAWGAKKEGEAADRAFEAGQGNEEWQQQHAASQADWQQKYLADQEAARREKDQWQRERAARNDPMRDKLMEAFVNKLGS